MTLVSKLSKWLSVVLLVSSINILTVSAVSAEGTKKTNSATDLKSSEQTLVEKQFHQVLKEWEKKVKNSTSFESAVSPNLFKNVNERDYISANNSKDYNESVINFTNNKSVNIELNIPEDALYEVGFDYYGLSKEIANPELSIKINGQYQFYESRRIVAPINWKDKAKKFEKNNYGNELIPEQVQIKEWNHVMAQDPSNLQPEPLRFHLKKGKNIITLTNTSGSMLLGRFYVQSPKKLFSYEDYKEKYFNEKVQSDLITIEAEHPYLKNTSRIRPITIKSPDVIPYKSNELLLNSLYGGESAGESVTWKVNVKKAGKYELAFKMLQNEKSGSPVFRRVLIDGKIPFKEVEHYKFDFSEKWQNKTLTDEKSKPYYFYLDKGEHEVTLVADASPVEPVIHNLKDIMDEINDLSLSIKKLTGNSTDTNRDWKITEYLPDIKNQLTSWIERLKENKTDLQEIYGNTNDTKSLEEVDLSLIITKLNKLKNDPDKIPKRLTDLSDGSNSASQILGNIQSSLQTQPLLFDRVYVYGNTKLPKATSGFFNKFTSKVKEFYYSFTKKTYDTSSVDKDTVEVWVNRNQQYVELMQNMADSTFTAETGIKVKFSVMPNEQKLILANAGNQQPDVALGISVGTPYELAMRGAAADLSKFKDFKEYIHKFSPGAFMPMMVDNKVYALPETQDFYVLYYRKDILNKLNIPIPNTWTDVKEMLPELQRYGLNFFVPLSGTSANKAFMFTAPFIFQHGGDLYAKDGMSTAIDSEQSIEGMKLMTDLYTMYSLPLQVPNFYNSFRYGSISIGISNFETYIKLTSAAPEIAGSWDIALYPGVEQKDGSVSRWATGSAQSAMMFEKSTKQEQSWKLLKWWMSTKTQTDFATNLQTIYGTEYMWNSANLEAFKNAPLPVGHKKVILEQWKYLMEVPKTPGAYMIEREISNSWNKVVFNGANLRASIDDSTIIVDREIRRKMEEFGYMKDGKVVKPYILPRLETVKKWVGTNNE
ncbi:extracellular solute-binding protein [Bacillus sp. AFS041924]|uniref:extracellular solute-binding protein n=1 Tax=Bacillus sp. AFS041924 TaxID=2033503 RepID=UPI000BFCED7D|nr:extracellular solute-binding protein [Bacillus sp. AFS041924]PGS48759.1 ABC transporter substrate-binding protein [Bacillus sp. AFS041924]